MNNLDFLKVSDLKALAKSKGLRGYSKLRKAELIDLLRESEGPQKTEVTRIERHSQHNTSPMSLNDISENHTQRSKDTLNERPKGKVIFMDDDKDVFVPKDEIPMEQTILDSNTKCKYSNATCYNLAKLCKERGIKYATSMKKKELIEVLKWNDEDYRCNVHPDVQERMTKYQFKYREDHPEQREKARECTRRWELNNPERVEEYFSKWRERLRQENLRGKEKDSSHKV